ncbi:MAG: hypothetical protein AAF363_05475 [Bacteroidota bacterium]
MLFSLIISEGVSQNISFETGARSFGVGNANLLMKDTYALINNIARISSHKDQSAFLAYDNRFGIGQFQTLSAAYIHPFDFGNFGISFSRFGNDLFNQQSFGLGFADKIGVVELGLKLNYLQTNIIDFGTSNALVAELGASAEILPILALGLRVFNLNQANLISNEQIFQNVPTIVGIGLDYKPSSKIDLFIQLDQDLDNNTNFKAGIEFSLIKEVVLRSGINTEPIQNFFGVGFKEKSFSLDYALASSQDLGLSHNASLSYTFKKAE